MENKNQQDIPKHIKELVQPTPSGIAKLLAAWGGLSSETQILILSILDEIHAPAYLVESVKIRALDNDNAYVRYLAARSIHFDEDPLIKEKIENDPDPLVKYCLMETSSMIPGLKYKEGRIEELDGPALFFKLPHEARLAKVRSLIGNGEQIASLITHAVDHELKNDNVSELELFEILSDYVSNSEKFEEHDYEGKDIESLWNLVPKLPEGVSYPLIERLPEWFGLTEMHGNVEIPGDVLKSLSNGQLDTLLSRPDIELTEFRKEIFSKACEKGEFVSFAAVRHNFDLTYEEFAEILSKPKEKRIDILESLGFSDGLKLCLLDSISDIMRGHRRNRWSRDEAASSFDRKLKTRSLGDWKNSTEVTDLKLYRLATMFIPWRPRQKQPIPDELMFLQEAVVEGDTWATFIAFSNSWSRGDLRFRYLDKHLPRIYEIDKDDWEQDEPNLDAESAVDTELINNIDDKLTEIQQTINTTESSGLQNDLQTLGAKLSSQKLLIYAVIGLLIWLVFTQN